MRYRISPVSTSIIIFKEVDPLTDNEQDAALASRVCVVTGGGRGIGQAIAQELANHGASVAVVARTQEQLDETVASIESEGGNARSWSADITVDEQVRTVMEEIERELGPINLLVNNAGRASATGPLWLVDPNEWWRDVEINLKGAFLCTHAVLPSMIERGKGRIVNLGSNVAVRPTPNAISYSCSKAALLRFTDSLAESVSPLGLHVFAVSPGWVWTEMTEQAVKAMETNIPDFEGIPEEFVRSPERIAELVARLATGGADALSGRYIHVDDDLDAMLKNVGQIRNAELYSLKVEYFNAE